MDAKLAIEGPAGTEFIPIRADDGWLEKHPTRDDAEAVALATSHAERGVRLFRALAGDGAKVTNVRLTTKIPDGSDSLINPELGLTDGLSCFICLCDDATPPNCVCTPC
jgi:hypothetical protein